VEALTGLFGIGWLIVTLVWVLTFVGPSRRAIARGVLAPYHIPLRRARWVLGLSATAFFVAGVIVAPPEKQSAPSASATTAASPVALETQAPALETPAPALETPAPAASEAETPAAAETPAPASFTTEQFESARKIFCETENNVLGQTMAKVFTNRRHMNADAMNITAIGDAVEKAKVELRLSDTDAMQLMNQMMKEYPEVGRSTSAGEAIKACQEYGELSD
jgi:hypothetical protein